MTRRLALITAAVSVLLVAAFWFAAWRPTSHQLAAAHKRLSDAQTLQGNLKSQVVTLKAEQKNVPTYQSELKALQEAVPSSESLDTIIDQLTVAAAASGVGLPSVSPAQSVSPSAAPTSAQKGQKTPSVSLSSVTLTITAQGTYPQLIKFVSLLESSPRLFVVDSMAISGASGGQGMSSDLSVRAFYAGPSTGSAS